MRSNFNRALERVLVYEGGYNDHPRDPGGPTNRGIIQRVYDGYRRGQGQEPRSVRQITMAEVRDIYRRQYADKIAFDALPAGVDFVMFDGAVNSGPAQATKWLQRALNMPRVDGDLGQATLAAVKAHPDHDILIAAILQRRLGMLRQLKTWPIFGKGWSARIASCKAIGQAWATGSVGPAPVAVSGEGGGAKASVADVDLPTVPEEAGINTGAAGGGLAVSVQTASGKLEPLLGTSKTLDIIYAALTIAGVAIVIGGGVYWLWAKRKRKAAERAWSGEATADLDPLMAGA